MKRISLPIRLPSDAKYLPKGVYTLVYTGPYAHDGSPSFAITNSDNEPMMTLTRCHPEHKAAPGCILVKNYSENEGILEAMIGAGLVQSYPRPRAIPTGYTNLWEVEMSPQLVDMVTKGNESLTITPTRMKEAS